VAPLSHHIYVVHLEWLHACHSKYDWIDEDEYRADISLIRLSKSLSTTDSIKSESFVRPTLTYRPSCDSGMSQKTRSNSGTSIMMRRSDASSMPLRPDGVFKGLSMSIFGWSDPRLETSVVYQLTSNGARVVKLNDSSQYVCVCADGARPTNDSLRLVSSRWVNDCLAQEKLIEPTLKALYTPSKAQLPILTTFKCVLYISEKDQSKYDQIAELAKLCGLRYVSRSESRVLVSAVTHFIFHDIGSLDRRRDLIPLAKQKGKSIVTYEWLANSYLTGQLCDEAPYDISGNLPAIDPS
jgi:hypothetical protein